MKKRTLLLLLTAFFISAVSIAQTAYPWFPYWNAGNQDPWAVPTDKTTDNEADFVGTVDATWTQSAALFDQANNGAMPSMAGDTTAKVFITGVNEKNFSLASHPRKVSEAADFNSGAAWKGGLNVFDTRSAKAYYSVSFAEPGEYSLYLRIRGDGGSKYAAKLTQKADYTGVNWVKDWGQINLDGLTASSNTGDMSTDNKAEYVGIGLGQSTGTIGETGYNRNSVYWFKAINDADGIVTIPAAGTYILYVDHVSGGSFTGFGGFTFLKLPNYVNPGVTLNNPANNQNHKDGVELTLTATTKLNGNYTITGLEFFEGTNSLGAATSTQENIWTLNWTPTVGVYNVTAVATDSKDSITTSNVSVLNVADIPDDVWADTIPNDSLIISEIMLSGPNSRINYAYMELTNMSSKTIDLAQFFTYQPNQNASNKFGNSNNNDGDPTDFQGRLKIRLSGLLAPGESHVIFKRAHSGALDGYGNEIYPWGQSNHEIEAQANRVTGDYNSGAEGISQGNGIFILGYNQGLAYVHLNGDSVPVDIFGPTQGDPETTNNKPGSDDIHEVTIAGKNANDPVRDFIWVRKFDIKKGNMSFNEQRGIDEVDSEWIPLPRSMQNQYDHAFTTIGKHGASTELTLSSDIATIDMNSKVITFPYGVARDSVFRQFDKNDNVGWDFKMGPDTSQYFVQTGDTLNFYVAGQGVSGKYSFHANVLPQAQDFAQTRPEIYKNNAGNWVKNYSISDGTQPMDTIGNIPFHESIDTFIKYMAMDASLTKEGLAWKITPKSGNSSPEIEYGDILEITASNGAKKEYLLATNTFFPNHDATLSMVMFPGLMLFENPETYELTDTFLSFVPKKLDYVIKLPIGTKTSPAMVTRAANSRATVEVMRAKDLSGTAEGKTALIKVTAEDDTTVQIYEIYFDVEREAPTVKGTIFLSELARGWGRYSRNNAQVYNPLDEAVDLTEYVFFTVRGDSKWGSVTGNTAVDKGFKAQNAYLLRPGYKVVQEADGKVVFATDFIQESFLLESKGVYAIAATMAYPMGNPGLSDFTKAGGRIDTYGPKVDIWLDGPGKIETSYGDYKWWKAWCDGTGFPLDPYGEQCLLGDGFDFASNKGNSFIIAKIVNDSIKDGLKSVALSEADILNDYEFVDVFNGVTGSADYTQFDNDTVIPWETNNNYRFMRKQHVYKGIPEDVMSFGRGDSTHTIIPSEWNLYQGNVRFEQKLRFGEHSFLSTAHISYLTSPTYLLGDGLVGTQDIIGVQANTKGSEFMGNLIKADTGMFIKVLNTDDTEKELDNDMMAGDKVWSYSANGFDSVLYVVKSIASLSDDCSLTSGTYTVSKADTTGLIAGVKFGTSIIDLLDELTPAAGSTMLQTDGGEVILPLTQYDNDTVKTKVAEKIDVIASTRVFIEVVAQDKVTKCVYAIQFEDEAMPFLLSNVYKVDEDNKIIDFVSPVTPEKFLSYLIVSPGATAKVMNKADQHRTTGIMKYDDRVHVMKGDILVTYFIKYSNEMGEGSGVENKVKQVSKMSLTAYPNPTTNSVQLQGFTGISKISIHDISGRMIQVSKTNSINPVIDLKSYPTGIYFINVMSSVGKSTLKVIKE